MQGIYAITCVPTGEQYIGQSSNTDKRWESHREKLVAGSHPNKKMTSAYLKYGADAFVFRVIEVVADAEMLTKVEVDHITRLRPAFNTRPVFREEQLPPVQIPAGYRLGIANNPETGKRAYFLLKQDAQETSCWREVAGPFTTRGGAVQRLGRMLMQAQNIPPAP